MLNQFKTHILTSSLLLSCGGSTAYKAPDKSVNEICQQMNSKVRNYLDQIGVEFESFQDVSTGLGHIDTLGFYNKGDNKIYITENLPMDINSDVCLHESLHAYLHHENINVTNKRQLVKGFTAYLNDNNHEPWALANLYSEIEGQMKTFNSTQISRIKINNKAEEIALYDLILKAQYLLDLSSDYKHIVKLGPFQSISQKSYLTIKESTDNIQSYFDEILELAAKIPDKPSNFIIYLEKIKLYASVIISQYYYNTDFTEVLIKVLLKHKSGAELTANERKIYESVSLRNSDFQNIFY